MWPGPSLLVVIRPGTNDGTHSRKPHALMSRTGTKTEWLWPSGKCANNVGGCTGAQLTPKHRHPFRPNANATGRKKADYRAAALCALRKTLEAVPGQDHFEAAAPPLLAALAAHAERQRAETAAAAAGAAPAVGPDAGVVPDQVDCAGVTPTDR